MAYPDMTPGPPLPVPPPTTPNDTGAKAAGSFDVDGAKQAGYSDAEIANHLAADANFDAPAARKAGYSDKELITHLTAPQPTGLEGYPEEAAQAAYAQSFPQPAPRPAARPAPAPNPARGGIGDPGTLSGALAEGFRTGPRIVDQPAIDQAERSGPLGYYVTSPLMQIANAPLQGLNAAYKGGQATIESLLTPLNPILGTNFARDIAAMPEAFPTGVPEEATYSGRGTTLLRPPPSVPPAPQFYGEPVPGAYGPPVAPKPPTPEPTAFVPPGVPQGPTLSRINELIQADIEQAQRRPAEIPPTTTKDPVTGEVQPIQQPPNPADVSRAAQPQPQPTAVWRSADYDFPVTPTGVEQTHTDGRVYAQVSQPDGSLSYVPKDELVTQGAPSQPAGAQITPTAVAGLTPEQAAAAGSTADKQWYYKTVIPGEVNDIEWIKGINPTMAQREQTVNAARDSKNLRRISEDADQNERALLGQHSDIRKGEFQDIAGSDVTQQTDMKAASDQIERDLQAAYAHGGKVDLQPVISAAQAELTGSAGKLPPVRSAMKQIMDAAQKDDGTGLETDPRQANAVRRVIIYLQSAEGRKANPGYGDRDVMAAMTRVKDVLTKQVEPAAPGFTKANADYAAARQAADVREALQAYEPKLYQGPLGNMTFAPFHRLMGEVIAGRDPRAPMNPYKAMTEEQFNRLKSLHESLQQAASAEELSKAAGGGSDTSQTLFDMAKKAARTGVSTAGGAVAGFAVGHVLGHEAGMATGMFTKSALDSLFSQRAVAQATAEHNRLLRPDLTQYPLKPNPLMNPPSP